MKKLFALVGILCFLMLSNIAFAITGKHYEETIQCGGFECAPTTDYWYEGGVTHPVLDSVHPHAGTYSYRFYATTTTSNLESAETSTKMYLYYVGYNTSIEYWLNASANLTGSGYFDFMLLTEDGMTSYKIDHFGVGDILNTTWTSRRWHNEVNSTVPYGYYRIFISLGIPPTPYLWVDDILLEGTIPVTYNLTVMVFSDKEYVNDTTCSLNITDATVSVANITQSTANYSLGQCCYYQGTWHNCTAYQFVDISEGTHPLSVSKLGYDTYEQSVIVDANMGINVWLTAATEKTLTVYVKNTTDDYVPNAKGTLYYQNGTKYKSSHLFDLNPQFTSSAGVLRWVSVPVDSYYYILERAGYYVYTSPIFYLGESKTFTNTLEATAVLLTLTTPKNNGTIDETFNFTINVSGLVPPLYQAHYWIRSPDGAELPYLMYIQTYDYGFTIYGADYFDDGLNCVWVTYQNYISNEVCIDVSDVYGVAGGAVMSTPLVGIPFTVGAWVGLFFSPFSIITMFLVGIGAWFEYQVKSQGAIFLAVIMIGSLAFSYMGMYPPWVGVLIAIICAAILTKAVLKLW